MEEIIRILIAIILLFTIYFWPTSFALLRNSSKSMGIFVVNFLLGWTGLGWLVCLVWSFTSESNSDKNLRIASYQNNDSQNIKINNLETKLKDDSYNKEIGGIIGIILDPDTSMPIKIFLIIVILVIVIIAIRIFQWLF
mgnify:CR=1 FL=1|tara:strand:+ start:62 stop:478 length:417 start_codon:yes stop_codon:yes gene_type:complete